MRLKSLEIQGFKTFPDKTKLSFDDGITAVVGPNGSGKSNISDAIRWVLGEQSTRSLRCDKMEELIFNGTPRRKAQGFAEVTLTIDNSERQLPFDNDTVAVTRRYYRSGESEYLLNKVNVRLRDINDLFMDTGLGRDGYSMVGQGKIDSIVAARGEDRREVFEEAAGISRYRYRKQESESRLQKAEDNLLRLQDILSELEERVEPLRIQSEKAQQYLEFAGEKRTLEIGLWLHTLEKSGRVLREQDDKILVAKNDHSQAEDEIDRIDGEIDRLYTESAGCTARVDETRQEIARLEEAAARKDGEVSVLENDIFHNKESVERLLKEIDQSASSGEAIDGQIGEKQGQISQKSEEIQAREEDVRLCEQELSELRLHMSETGGKIADYSRELSILTSRSTEARIQASAASTSIEEIRLRQETIRASLQERNARQEKALREREDYSAMLAETEEKIRALGNTVQGYGMRLESRNRKAEEYRKDVEKLHLDAEERSRRARLLEELERNLEGFSQSVKVVMREVNRGSLSGVRGPVSRLIRTPKEYAVAIEIALGPAMQNIVVDTEQDAKRAIQLLKQRDSGRATFLPLSTIRGRTLQEQGLEDCPGFVGLAGELCRCEPEYKGILESLLGRIAVAEDLDSAVAMARRFGYRFRIVTLDGQVVNAGGSLTGGSLNRNAGLLSRTSEIERFRAEAESLKRKEQEASAALKAAREEAAREEASLAAAKGELTTAQEDKVRLEAALRNLEDTLAGLERDGKSLAGEAAAGEARLSELSAQKSRAEEAVAGFTASMEELQARLSAISGSRDEQNRKSDEIAGRMQELRMGLLSLEKDRDSLLAAVEDLKKRKEDHAGRAEELRSEIQAVEAATALLGVRIDSLKKEAEALRQEAKEKNGAIEELNRRRMELEKETAELRLKQRESSDRREKAGHELARLEERRDNLQKEYDSIISRLWEEYELTRREAEEVGAKIEDPPKAQRRLAELKNRIRALGPVNPGSVEEYKEVKERYDFLKGQIEDVEKSRGELRAMISDLTRQMRELFIARFRMINENFGRTFKELFGGGEASVTLSDPENILTCGIDIHVQPPGKIVHNLESLSGGEKALVAISLYFAIMRVNPPPFCVMDEIEAALDDVNVDRFASYLRRMNQSTQFIVITHRRGTMEEADVLYGVTMQDEGISSLLELRTAEVEQKLGIGVSR